LAQTDGLLIAAALAVSASLASAQAVNVTLSEWKVGLDRDTVQAGSVTFKVAGMSRTPVVTADDKPGVPKKPDSAIR